MFEVEIKFAVSEPNAYKKRLKELLGVTLDTAKTQTDLFFQGIDRDFALTDECLRIRMHDDEIFLTYKGARRGKDSKTREELEFPLVPVAQKDEEAKRGQLSPEMLQSTFRRWKLLLTRLGFRESATLSKQRCEGTFVFEGHQVNITLDELPFGYFSEVEIVCSTQDEQFAATESLKRLTSVLGTGQPIRETYLELACGSGIDAFP